MEVNWNDATESLTELAFVDEADSYEVDQYGIYFDTKTNKFYYISASGCSCWDGEAQADCFNSIDEIEDFLGATPDPNKAFDEQHYLPSVEGSKVLVDQAKIAYQNLIKSKNNYTTK